MTGSSGGGEHTAGRVHLGSGLSISDGKGFNAPQKPYAFPMPDNTWRAQISGTENGCTVTSWFGPTFARKADALLAAITKATRHD